MDPARYAEILRHARLGGLAIGVSAGAALTAVADVRRHRRGSRRGELFATENAHLQFSTYDDVVVHFGVYFRRGRGRLGELELDAHTSIDAVVQWCDRDGLRYVIEEWAGCVHVKLASGASVVGVASVLDSFQVAT